VNEVIYKLCARIKDSKKNKKGQQPFFELLPSEVGFTDQISNHFLEDIRVIADLEVVLKIEKVKTV
jgi:hypothetical protein